MSERISVGTAAQLLGVSPEATPAEARSAFLQRLERVDFLPSEEWCAGAAVLMGETSAGGLRFGTAAMERCASEELRADVEAFCRDFWSLSLPERTERWQRLQQRAKGNLPLGEFLRSLFEGIGVEADEFIGLDGLPGKMAGFIKEAFALRPLEKAARRREWLAEITESIPVRLDAVRLFRDTAHRLAALESDWLDQCVSLWKEAAYPRPARIAPIGTVEKAGSAKGKGYEWTNYLIFGVGFLLLKAILVGFSTSSSPSQPDRVPSNTSNTQFHLGERSPKFDVTTGDPVRFPQEVKRQFDEMYSKGRYDEIPRYDFRTLIAIGVDPEKIEVIKKSRAKKWESMFDRKIDRLLKTEEASPKVPRKVPEPTGGRP